MRRLVARIVLPLLIAAPAAAQVSPTDPGDGTAATRVRQGPVVFEIAAIDVTGVTALSADVIETAIYPHLGPDRGFADVEQARKAIEAAYRAAGFESAVVAIPPQPEAAFGQGVIRLDVVEAPLARVKVTGSKYHSIEMVRAELPSMVEGQMPDFTAFQQELNNANQLADREIVPLIKPGAVPGTLDVELKVEDTLPLHASLELNNDYAVNTRPLRLTASLSATNLWQAGHSLQASFLTAPQDTSQVKAGFGSYAIPFRNSPWTLQFTGAVSNNDVATLGNSRSLGDGYQFGSRLKLRLPSNAGRFQSLSFGFDYKDYKQDLFIPSTDPAIPDTTIQTPIRYLPITAAYTLGHTGDATTLIAVAGVTAGVRGFGLNDAALRDRRFDAIGNFVRVNLDISYRRSFAGDFVLALRGSGQLADSPLLTNEQLVAGGAATVRGYYQAEAVGDDGLTGLVEAISPSLASVLGTNVINEWRFFAFTDVAWLKTRRALAEQVRSQTLLGVGGGTRIQLLDHVSGDLTIGIPLTNGPTTKKGDARTNFSIRAEF